MLKVIKLVVVFFLVQPILAKDFDAQVLKHETHVQVVSGRLVKRYDIQIQINNRGGEKYTRVYLPYTDIDRISNIDAAILDRHGNIIRKLKKKDIVDKSNISDISLFEESYVKEFTLKHNVYPYVIEYSYEEKVDEFLYIHHWVPLVDDKIPTQLAKLTIHTPIDYKLAITSSRIDNFRTDTIESIIKYEWGASYNEIAHSETFSPPKIKQLPEVTVVPIEFKYAYKGSFESWESFGNWQLSLLAGLDDLPNTDRDKVKQLVENISDEKEKIKVLYHYLQDETRYINVTIETGGLKPYPASYVSQNQYGDCKALTNYFKSLLEEVSIKSYYTKVYASDNIKYIDTSFPSQQFNHIILFIPLANDTVWLDCTSDGPFGYLGTFTQNRYGFIISEESSLLKTPALNRDEVHEHRNIKVAFEKGKVEAHFKNSYRGDGFELLNHLEQEYSEAEQERVIREYLVEDGFEIDEFFLSNFGRDSLRAVIEYSAKNNSLYKEYGSEMLMQVIPFDIVDIEPIEKRETPLQIDYPVYKTDHLVYQIPANTYIKGEIESRSISTPFGDYLLHAQVVDNLVIIDKSFYLKSGSYSLERYPDFYRFLSEVQEADNLYLVAIKKQK